MRTLRRVGAIALVATTVLLGGAVTAQAAPGAVTVTVNRLVLEPGQYGHTGSVRIVIKNRTAVAYDGGIEITEPIAKTFGQFVGTGPCGLGTGADGRTTAGCSLESPIQPGANGVVTVTFRSPAKPQPYAQIAPAPGSVEVDGAAPATFQAVFRSTAGKLTNPQPYVQDTEGKLTVTAGDVTLNRQDDGTYLGVVPVTVRNDGDAPHRSLWTEIAIPAGVGEWPGIVPSDVCVGGSTLPTPPGGFTEGCSVYGDQLAEGQERTFQWVLTAPAGTAAGPLGTGTTSVTLAEGPSQTDGANVHTFGITVAG